MEQGETYMHDELIASALAAEYFVSP